MKQVISFLLMVSILILSASAYSETLDYASMTDEQLIEMQSAIHTEIMKRGLIKKIKLPAGVYEVGIDLPAGKYLLTTMDDVSLMQPAQILLYDSMYGYLNRNSSNKTHRLMNEVFYNPSSCVVLLEDGYVVYLVNGEFYAEKYNLMNLFD